jgi:hypothetical protein
MDNETHPPRDDSQHDPFSTSPIPDDETSREHIEELLKALPSLPQGLNMVHPLVVGGASLHQTLEPFSAAFKAEDICSYLTDAICHEDIDGLADPAAMLAVQSRVLDAVFNRFLLVAVKNIDQHNFKSNAQYLKIALQAQRQSRDAIAVLRKQAAGKNKIRGTD